MSMREFLTLLQGLMSVDSRIVRYLQRDDAPALPPEGNPEGSD